MACSSASVGEGLEELEEEITCPVCHDHFQEPKILPCCHYYCKKCIHALARAAGANKPFPCPECRSETLLPQNDPSQLPTAFFVNRMKETHAKMEKATGKVEAHCEMCSGGPATAFCRQCTYFICSACVKSHQKMKVFASHSVATLDELKKGGAKQILTKHSPSPRCNTHDKKMKLYCYDCETFICRDCIVFDHVGHRSDFIKKTAPQTKVALVNQVTQLKDAHTKICNALEDIKSAYNDIVVQRSSTADEIEESFQEIHKLLDKQKLQLFSEADRIAKQKMKQLSLQEKTLLTSADMIQSVVDFVEQSVENSTDEELMSIHQQVTNRIDEVVTTHCKKQTDLEPVEEADMKLNVKCLRTMQEVCQANVIVSTGIPSLNVKINLGSEVKEINKAMEMSLKITLPNGKLTKRTQNIVAEVKSKVDGKLTAVQVHRKKDLYKVKYTPEIRGCHELTVTVNGEQVPGSPFPVFVNIPLTQLGNPVQAIKGLANPWGITFNSIGEVLITECTGDIVKINKRKEKVAFIKRSAHNFISPAGIDVDEDDSVYMTDCSAGKLYKFDKAGKLIKAAPEKGKMDTPRGVTVSSKYVFVCESGKHQIRVYSKDLELVKRIGQKGSKEGELNGVRNMTVSKEGNFYICDTFNDRIQLWNSEGEHMRTFCWLRRPQDVVMFEELLYVTQENSVSIFSKDSSPLKSFGESPFDPFGVHVDCNGFIYVCDFNNSRIKIF